MSVAKTTTMYSCTNCDAQFTKWTGRCLECGKWGTIQQTQQHKRTAAQTHKDVPAAKTTTLSAIQGKDAARVQTSISELDRVLGGGLVPGSLILLGGEPGIGKSTLSIQIANALSPTLYISGEESVQQIKLRADRLNITNDTLQLANETNVEAIAATITTQKPALAIVDSMQTIWSTDVESEPGNVSQIRACTSKLLDVAKRNGVPVILIGHVTKDGTVAGPRTLEHLVDTVLYLEGDRYHQYRMLRTVKNRFGATDEVGVFSMTQDGLTAVTNPSASFLAERGENMPGSVVTCLMEGTRPVLLEIQALVNQTSFGYPVRKASGFDLNRLHVLAAVLEKRAGLPLGQFDIHINVVSGMKTREPAADLAVCLAITSSFKDKALGKDLVVFGEVGLGGEVRSTTQMDKRVNEAKKLGMKRVITSKSTHIKKPDGIRIIGVANIEELIRTTQRN